MAFKVYSRGTDCDGQVCNRTYNCESEQEAIELCDDLNEWSDGLVWYYTTS